MDAVSAVAVLLVIAVAALAAWALRVAWRRAMRQSGQLQIWRGLARRGLAPEDAAGHARAFAIAVRRCALCNSLDECEHWLAGGRHDPSAFCPNSTFMENLQREKRRRTKTAP